VGYKRQPKQSTVFDYVYSYYSDYSIIAILSPQPKCENQAEELENRI